MAFSLPAIGKFVGFGWLRSNDSATKMNCIGVSRHARAMCMGAYPRWEHRRTTLFWHAGVSPMR